MSKAQAIANANINKTIAQQEKAKPADKVVSIVPETEEKLPDTITIPSIAPMLQSPTHQTRRHSITIDIEDLSSIRKSIGMKAHIFFLILIEFGKEAIIYSGQNQELDVFAFAKRYDLNPSDVHKVFTSIKELHVVGHQLKIPFTYNPPTDED